VSCWFSLKNLYVMQPMNLPKQLSCCHRYTLRWKKSEKLVAKWNTRVAKIYNEICVEGVNARNMP
jgi:hypothetical protein